eukprot:Rhum_TRINITY_DN11718_c0_g1::Rhum_TRINITY_DN11718_c0_g1_i1::g.46497::m.46497
MWGWHVLEQAATPTPEGALHTLSEVDTKGWAEVEKGERAGNPGVQLLRRGHKPNPGVLHLSRSPAAVQAHVNGFNCSRVHRELADVGYSLRRLPVAVRQHVNACGVHTLASLAQRPAEQRLEHRRPALRLLRPVLQRLVRPVADAHHRSVPLRRGRVAHRGARLVGCPEHRHPRRAVQCRRQHTQCLKVVAPRFVEHQQRNCGHTPRRLRSGRGGRRRYRRCCCRRRRRRGWRRGGGRRCSWHHVDDDRRVRRVVAAVHEAAGHGGDQRAVDPALQVRRAVGPVQVSVDVQAGARRLEQADLPRVRVQLPTLCVEAGPVREQDVQRPLALSELLHALPHVVVAPVLPRAVRAAAHAVRRPEDVQAEGLCGLVLEVRDVRGQAFLEVRPSQLQEASVVVAADDEAAAARDGGEPAAELVVGLDGGARRHGGVAAVQDVAGVQEEVAGRDDRLLLHEVRVAHADDAHGTLRLVYFVAHAVAVQAVQGGGHVVDVRRHRCFFVCREICSNEVQIL